VFRALPADQAGLFLRAFFPRYYAWGILAGGAAVLVALSSTGWLAAACALVTGLFVYARQFLMPQINRARDAELVGESGADRRFRVLHMISVLVNGLQLLILVAAAAFLVWTRGAGG
jgi:hypothetical protein